MFCKKCGAPTEGDATICQNCMVSSGTGVTPASLNFTGTQVQPQNSSSVKSKKSTKKILISVIALVLVAILGIGGVTVYGMVFNNPMKVIYNAIEKTLQASNASFDFELQVSEDYDDFEIDGKGFFSLGKDINNSVAYVDIDYFDGYTMTAGIFDGKAAEDENGYLDVLNIDNIIEDIEEDFEYEIGTPISFSDIVKNEKLNLDKLDDLYSAYRDYFKEEEDIDLPEYKEVLGVLQDFFMKECKKKDVREQFLEDYEKESVSGGTNYSFTFDMHGLGEALGTYLASLTKYDDLYDIVIEDFDADEFDTIDKIVEVYFESFGRNDVEISITVDRKGYISELEGNVKGPEGQKASANLEIDEINKLDPDTDKVDDFIEDVEDDMDSYNGYDYY